MTDFNHAAYTQATQALQEAHQIIQTWQRAYEKLLYSVYYGAKSYCYYDVKRNELGFSFRDAKKLQQVKRLLIEKGCAVEESADTKYLVVKAPFTDANISAFKDALEPLINNPQKRCAEQLDKIATTDDGRRVFSHLHFQVSSDVETGNVIFNLSTDKSPEFPKLLQKCLTEQNLAYECEDWGDDEDGCDAGIRITVQNALSQSLVDCFKEALRLAKFTGLFEPPAPTRGSQSRPR